MSIKSDLNDSIVPKSMNKDNQDYYQSNLQTVEMIALTALLGYNIFMITLLEYIYLFLMAF